MAKPVAIAEPNFPWVDQQEDKSFRILSIAFLVVFLIGGFVLNSIELPEIERKELVDISPRLAKLILEKKKVEPPPKPKTIPKKEEVKKKKEPEKKKEVKKKEPEKKKEQPKKKETARDVAQNAGLLKLKDELEDLRELFDADDVLALPQQTTGDQAVKVAAASDKELFASGTQQASGGIQTDTLNRELKTSELAQRKTTQVESTIESDQSKLAKAETTSSSSGSQSGSQGKKRSEDEIERVFQTNKSGIFNLYNRALRKNPSLSGQVVVELTIAPDGSVSDVRIISSELGDEALERKLILKIKKFKFKNANYAEITVTYPIDFLPS